MKIDTDALDKPALLAALRAAYGLDLRHLRFLPRGEDAYAYVSPSSDGQDYFVRAQPLERLTGSGAGLCAAYRIVRWLAERQGIGQAVAPLPTQDGALTLAFGRFLLAVFAYIPGQTLWQRGASPTDLRQAARLLARVHDSAAALSDADWLDKLPRESFANPFAGAIRQLLAQAETGQIPHPGAPHVQEALALFQRQAQDVQTTLDRFQQLGQALARTVPADALTHGDPNLDNFLRRPGGGLHLTDWGEVALGPAERDLFAFTGPDFPIFLQAYRSNRSGIELRPQAFEFYFYRWALQEIADYGPVVLCGRGEAARQVHAWQELQPYLPIRHWEIAARVEQVAQQLQADE